MADERGKKCELTLYISVLSALIQQAFFTVNQGSTPETQHATNMLHTPTDYTRVALNSIDRYNFCLGKYWLGT